MNLSFWKKYFLKKPPLILSIVLLFILFFGPVLEKWQLLPLLLIGMSGKAIERKKMRYYLVVFLSCLGLPAIIAAGVYFVDSFIAPQQDLVVTLIVDHFSLHIGVIVFLIFSVIEGVQELMCSQKTGLMELLSALNAYLLIGLIYGEFYGLIARFYPGSFLVAPELVSLGATDGRLHNIWTYVYFSFMTQTTIGYGDITPVAHFPQVLAISQGILGQFYMAIVVAHLLRNYIVHQKGKNNAFYSSEEESGI